MKSRLSFAEALSLVAGKRREGFDALSLDGGEPTLAPFLPRLAGAALGAGYRSVNIITNGTVLADMRRVAAIRDCQFGREHPPKTVMDAV